MRDVILSDKVEVSGNLEKFGKLHGTVHSVRIETNLEKVFLLPINLAKSLFLRFIARGKVEGSQ